MCRQNRVLPLRKTLGVRVLPPVGNTQSSLRSPYLESRRHPRTGAHHSPLTFSTFPICLPGARQNVSCLMAVAFVSFPAVSPEPRVRPTVWRNSVNACRVFGRKTSSWCNLLHKLFMVEVFTVRLLRELETIYGMLRELSRLHIVDC